MKILRICSNYSREKLSFPNLWQIPRKTFNDWIYIDQIHVMKIQRRLAAEQIYLWMKA